MSRGRELELFIGSFFGVVPTNVADRDRERFIANATKPALVDPTKRGALAIACPVCGAAPGAWCVIEVLHGKRFDQALEASP